MPSTPPAALGRRERQIMAAYPARRGWLRSRWRPAPSWWTMRRMAPTCAPARAAFAWERRTGSSTRRGNIDAGAVEGAATLSTGAGNVSLRMMGRGGDVETTSGRGSVDLVLPRDFDATLEVAAAYFPGQPRPRITSDVPLDRRDTRDAAGRPAIRATGHAGGGRQRVVVRTAGGDVRIRRSP